MESGQSEEGMIEITSSPEKMQQKPKSQASLVRETMQSLLNANRNIPRSVIIADPPWPYNKTTTGTISDSVSQHYTTMSIDSLCKLDVSRIAADNCILLMWGTGPHMVAGVVAEVVRAWGFTPKTMFMNWIKTTNGEIKRNRLGYYTRQCVEYVALATRGSTLRLRQPDCESIANVYFGDTKKHSEKPNILHEVVDKFFHDVPKFEMFARRNYNDKWDCWGNELESPSEQEIQRLDPLRQSQLENAQALDNACTSGTWGGIKYYIDGLDTYLDGDDMDTGKKIFSIEKEHKDFMSSRDYRIV